MLLLKNPPMTWFLDYHTFLCIRREYESYPFCIPKPVCDRYDLSVKVWEQAQCKRMECDHE